MSETSDVPWPSCLGKFDEESCRYFLYETGKRIVPNYPFSFGIEEVYGQILDRYGFEGTPDATSLLQELLEDEQNATGLGDDGDVWRSWRHSWRHRNDDARNPFIPRFGSLILQSPTPARIRYLKANNFADKFEDKCTNFLASSEPQTDNQAQIVSPSQHPEEASPILEKHNSDNLCRDAGEISRTVVCHGNEHKPPWRQRLRSFSGGEKIKSARHSRNLSTTDIGPTLSVLFESNADFADLCFLNSCDAISTGPQHVKDHQASDSGDAMPAKQGEHFLGPDAKIAKRNCERERHAHLQDNISRSASTKTSGSQLVAGLTNCLDSEERQPHLTPDHKRRAANRQARLIDGTIFTSRGRRSKAVGQIQPNLPAPSECTYKCSSGRLSWSPVKHRDSLRSNWREISRIFARDGNDKQTNGSSKHQSVPPPSKLATSRRPPTMAAFDEQRLSRVPRAQPQQGSHHIGLDGTSDSPSSFTLPPDLNKPLPLSPGEIVKSLSNRSPITSSQFSDNTSALPSRASTASSLSQSSSKKEFRDLARDLLQVDTLTAHELPPIREVSLNNKDLVDPMKTPIPPASPVSYSSLAQGNPFIEDSQSRAGAKSPALRLSKPFLTEEMPLRSPPLPALQFNAGNTPKRDQDTESYFPSLMRSKSAANTSPTNIPQPLRGRSRATPDLTTQSANENLPPKTPTKRSRSPFKRFLGLSKGDSANKLEAPETPPSKNTPGSATKESLKKWGDRIRYGFLTPDQEQLRQEELIDAHNNSSTNSTPQNSTFPISLEPPVQAKLQSEMELIITVTANKYLLHEARAGRITAESVAKTKELWEKMNRPQVIEFHFDQVTQHNLIMANLDRVKLHGDASTDAIAINSTMRGWKTMAREMSVRTFCSPDSVIRKHLHDAHRVLELLGAPLVTFLAYEDMQLKALAKINQSQKERMERRAGSAGRNASGISTVIPAFAVPAHRRNLSEGSTLQHHHNHNQSPLTHPTLPTHEDKLRVSPSPNHTPLSGPKVRKPTGADGAIMSLPSNFERARAGYVSKPRFAGAGQSLKET